MCLAVPARITKILTEQRAEVALNGVQMQINTSLVTPVNEGDFVIVHVGYALEKLDEDEALKTLALIQGGAS